MKLAFIIHELAPFRQHFIRQIAAVCPELRITVYLTLPDAGFSWHRDLPRSVEVHQLGRSHSRFTQGRLRSWFREYLKGKALKRLLDEEPPDVLFVGAYSDAAHRATLAWASFRSIPSLLWIDSNIRGDRARGLRSLCKRAVLKRLFQSVSAVLVCGDLGRQYAEKYGAPVDRIYSCPAIPDVTLLQASSEPAAWSDSPRKRFLYVGRIAPEKRVDLLVKSFIRIAAERPDWDLVIVGEGPLSSLRDRVPARLESRVMWLGAISRETELGAIYRSCNALVLPSDFEPWGVVVIEAALLGLALVCSDAVGAAAELLRPGHNGELFQTGDTQSLVRAMLSVSEPSRIGELQANSRTLARHWLTSQPGIRQLPVLGSLMRSMHSDYIQARKDL